MNRIAEWLHGPKPILVDQVPWLVKDFNVLYRCAKQALEGAQRDGFANAELVALQVHVTRLEPAFTDTEEVRKAMVQR